MWDLRSDDGRSTAREHAETPDEKAMRWPQAYSTMLGAHGYSTRENGEVDSVMDFRENLEWRKKLGMEKDRNVIERRQPKLTKK